jgi:hypothetical protein
MVHGITLHHIQLRSSKCLISPFWCSQAAHEVWTVVRSRLWASHIHHESKSRLYANNGAVRYLESSSCAWIWV